ncbi:hypothetical protein R3P38DRAFT_3237840 [Favolaschia claudopus]|uniref:Uncharacterized protein n=1 Tax=Favolaschia claudopus TaxID=2862362 RepID=A0AAV9ZBM6_9AGAR
MHTPLRDDLKDSSASPSPADYIDDEAVLSGVEEEDESEDDSIVNIDDPNEEDIAFINDSSDLSIHSDRELTKPSFASQEIDMDSDSDLSDLPLNLMKAVPPPKDDAAQDSDDDVIVVPTPSKLKGVRKRSRRLAHANTDEEDAAITPGDSMFDRGSAVKASTLPPPVATRSTRSASSNASDKSAVKAVAATKGNTAPKESPSSTAEGTPAKERPKPRKRAKTGKNDDGKDAQQPSGGQEGAAAVQSNSAGQPATPGDKAAQQPAVLSSDYLRDLLGEMLPAIQAAAAAPAVPSLPATSSTSQSAVNAASVVVPLATALPAAQPATIIRETTPLGQEPAGPNVSPGQMVNAVLENEDPRPAYSGQNGTSPRPPQEDDHGVLLSPFKAPTTPVDRNGKLAAWKESQANSNIRNMFMSSAASSGVSDIAVAPQLPSGTDTPPTGAPQANGSSVSENARYNMERLFASAGKKRQIDEQNGQTPESSQSASQPQSQTNGGAAQTKVHDDLTGYPVNYIPPVECEVFDEDLQDDAIKHLYSHLCNLPGDRSLLPSYVTSQDAADSRRGGRLGFSEWANTIKDFSLSTLISAISFVRCGRYINGSRAPLTDIYMRPTTSRVDNQVNSYRICVDNFGAVCVSVGMCTFSSITRLAPGANNKFRKYVAIVLHNQDWERLEAWTCICFNEQVLYCQMSGKAIQLTTRLSTPEETSEAQASRAAAQSMYKYVESPKKNISPRKPTSAKPPGNTPMTLGCSDIIPVYDARNVDFDFDTDLPNLENKLRPWIGEIPVGAFIVAGYSMHTYKGKVQGMVAQTLSPNLLWVVVCGVPIKTQ